MNCFSAIKWWSKLRNSPGNKNLEIPLGEPYYRETDWHLHYNEQNLSRHHGELPGFIIYSPLLARKKTLPKCPKINAQLCCLHHHLYCLNVSQQGHPFSSVQSLKSCPTLCDPMHWSTPGSPVHHQFPELAQTHVHRVGDAIEPSHPLSSPSPLAFNLSQHQGLFKWVSFFNQVPKVLELQLQHQSFQWIFRTDFL